MLSNQSKPYHYLIVGAGLFGSVVAWRAIQAGKRVKVIDRRNHVGGNLYCENRDGVAVHIYGPHIFHTSNKMVWEWVNSIVPFEPFINSPLANYKGKLYNLPFNMNTFHQLWGVTTAEQAQAIIASQRGDIKEPQNLEQQAISLVGTDIYNTLVKGYTEKQWGRDCRDLPADIIRRLPVRFTYDNNYFNDRWQGIPIGGYNKIIDALFEGVEVRCNTDFFADREGWLAQCDKIIFTGRIDEYYNYCFGALDYRSLRFEHEKLPMENYQGCAVVNYTEREVPYTRIIEHKHFEFGKQPSTVITREYPDEFGEGKEPYYPINDERNNTLAERYRALAAADNKVIFGGRLGEYRYYDMDKVIESALKLDL